MERKTGGRGGTRTPNLHLVRVENTDASADTPTTCESADSLPHRTPHTADLAGQISSNLLIAARIVLDAQQKILHADDPSIIRQIGTTIRIVKATFDGIEEMTRTCDEKQLTHRKE
jgi:hypothetical protein